MTTSFSDFPPQEGEVWVNIHTNKQATVCYVKENNVHTRLDGVEKCHTLGSFLSNWKRIKATSPWFLGIKPNV